VLDAIVQVDACIVEAAASVGSKSRWERDIVLSTWIAHHKPALAELVGGLFGEALAIAGRVIGREKAPVTVTACPVCGSKSLINSPGDGVACIMCIEAERLTHCQVERYRGELAWRTFDDMQTDIVIGWWFWAGRI